MDIWIMKTEVIADENSTCLTGINNILKYIQIEKAYYKLQ